MQKLILERSPVAIVMPQWMRFDFLGAKQTRQSLPAWGARSNARAAHVLLKALATRKHEPQRKTQ